MILQDPFEHLGGDDDVFEDDAADVELVAVVDGAAEAEVVLVAAVTGSEDAACFCLLGLCLLYTSPSPRDRQKSRMPSSA